MVSYSPIITDADGCGPSNPPIIELFRLYRIGKIEFGTVAGRHYSRWIYTSSDCSSYDLLYSASSPETIVWIGDIQAQCIKCEIDYGLNPDCARINIYELLFTNFLSISSDKYLITYPDNQFILSGNVRDQYNNPMINQTVNITVSKDVTTYFSGTAITDQNGNFSITIFTSSGQTFWHTGTYTVTVISDTMSQSLEIQTYESGNIAFSSICGDTLQPCPASVYIDNNPIPIGTTPITVTLLIGDHTYRISYPGYIDKTGTQTVELAVTHPINVTLDRQPNVLFNTNPQGASIYINTNLQPNVTPTGIYLVPGTYNYTLRLPCYEDITGQFTISSPSGEIITIEDVFIKNTGSLSITSTPSGANVYIDTILQPDNTPLSYICNQSNYTYVSEGTHSYIIFSPGYQSYKGTYNIIRNILTNVNVTLSLLGSTGTGSIYISTIPPGAKIFVDNIDTTLATPNIVTNIPIGEHTVMLDLDGYQINTSTIIVEGDTTTDVQLFLTPCISNWQCEPEFTGYEIDGCGRRRINTICTIKGNINFTSIPEGADIYLDNFPILDEEENIITTPYIVIDIPIGEHGYTLKLTGFNDYSGTVTVLENQTSDISAPLIPAEGCIYFSSSPEGAKIFVDNIDTGLTTPNIVCGLSLGTHTYRLSYTGYRDITGSTDLTTGQGNIISQTFIQVVEAGFGGAAMLLIAGLAIGAIYSSQEKKRQKEKYKPKEKHESKEKYKPKEKHESKEKYKPKEYLKYPPMSV